MLDRPRRPHLHANFTSTPISATDALNEVSKHHLDERVNNRRQASDAFPNRHRSRFPDPRFFIVSKSRLVPQWRRG
ncbi:MAG: hypothetical protein ACI8P0_002896 [Planctomycetaceae bacterium]